MKKVSVILADGFEEIEALTIVDLCRRAGIRTITVSITEDRQVTGSHKIPVLADCLLKEVDFAGTDMLVLPGGMPGTLNLEACPYLMDRVKEFHADGKCISAICAAPTILAHLGFLNGRNACCFPSMEEQLADAKLSHEPVEVSDHITTSRGMGTAMELGLAIVERFQGKETADRLAQTVVYKRI